MSEVKSRSSARRWLIVLAGGAVAIVIIAWLVHYFLVGQYFVATDDAYISADSSMVAAKVSGYVTEVAVRQNQRVSQGQLLAEIDPRDYQAALASAKADATAAQAQISSEQAQLPLQQAKIQAAKATLQGDAARLDYAGANARRYARLSHTGASTVQDIDQAKTALDTARATQEEDQANLLGAERQVDVLNAGLAHAKASLIQAQAAEQQAQLNLEHTRITAPFDGVVANKTVALGDYLQPGTQIMAIVPLNHVYVLANYKETQITNLRPGQPVTINVDAFPGLHVTGRVDSVAPAAGQQFALLPPDNATGNFTKIVQRVPVKIDLNLTPANIGKLRPGLSVEPSIDTRRNR
jgi:membrane fusion protein (multidrug efflux system)